MLDLQSPEKINLPAKMLPQPPAPHDGRPWLHAWAVFTLLGALLAVTTGSVVTTLRVGMADKDWPTAPLHLFTIEWLDKNAGYLIEHTHRLADWTLGLCIILLAAGLWFFEPRSWIRKLGIVALLGVILQGVLGGLRVRMDVQWGQQLRIMHGITAPLLLALLAGLVLFTARSWRDAERSENSKRSQRTALTLCMVVYLQVVFGAVLRHDALTPVAQRLHLLMAMVVIAVATWFVVVVRGEESTQPGLRQLIFGLKGLLVLQVLVGVESWMKRFPGYYNGVQSGITTSEVVIRTIHHVTGLALFAVVVTMTLLLHRANLENAATGQERNLEGTA